MRRKTTLVLGVLVIVFLGGVMMTSIGATTQRISPEEAASGEYDGQAVQVEGVINSDIERGDKIVFELAGNESMANKSVSKMDFDLDNAAHVTVVAEPEAASAATLEKGRWARVKGEIHDGVIEANEVVVDAHNSEQESS